MISELRYTVAQAHEVLRSTEDNLAWLETSGASTEDLHADIQKQMSKARNGLRDVMSDLDEMNRLIREHAERLCHKPGLMPDWGSPEPEPRDA
jgi:DNA repair ATPase RecN